MNSKIVGTLQAKHEYIRNYPEHETADCNILQGDYVSDLSYAHKQSAQDNGCYHHVRIW